MSAQRAARRDVVGGVGVPEEQHDDLALRRPRRTIAALRRCGDGAPWRREAGGGRLRGRGLLRRGRVGAAPAALARRSAPAAAASRPAASRSRRRRPPRPGWPCGIAFVGASGVLSTATGLGRSATTQTAIEGDGRGEHDQQRTRDLGHAPRVGIALARAEREAARLEQPSAAGASSAPAGRRAGYAVFAGGREQAQAELAQLRVVDRRGRAGQRVRAARGLRERDDVADRVAAGEQRDDAVDAERDPAVRRRAVAQRLEQEAEAPLRLLGVHPEDLEDLALDRRVVDADRAAAELPAVDDEVVGARAQRARVGRGRRSGAVNGWCSASQRSSASS